MVDPNWLLGFIEGEGCFCIGLGKSKTGLGYRVQPSFVIKLTISEKKVIERIKDTFGGIGGIYFESNDSNRRKGMSNANDSVSLRVTKLSDLRKIINFLDPLFFVSEAKRQDFEIWKECVNLIDTGKHKTKEGLLKIAEMREHIHKRKQWNKKDFCIIRHEVDSCEVYSKIKKFPANCEKCKTYKKPKIEEVTV